MKTILKIILAIMVLSCISYAGDMVKAPVIIPDFPILSGEDVMLMWTPVEGAVKYKIFQDGKFLIETPASPFSFKAPTVPGVYIYTVTGVDKTDNQTPASNAGELRIIKLKPPEEINHKFFGRILNLRWRSAPGAVTYKLFRSEKRDGLFTLVTITSDLRYVDSYVKEREENDGKSYFYKIISVDRDKKISHESNIYEVIIKKPFSTPINPTKFFKTNEVAFISPTGGKGFNIYHDTVFLSDGKSLVYVDELKNEINIIDGNGSVKKILSDKSAEPYKVDVDDEDNIYVLDKRKTKFFSYTKEGRKRYDALGHLVTEEDAVSEFEPLKERGRVKLTCIATCDDRVFLSDHVSDTIQIYDKDTGFFKGYLREKDTNKVLKFGGLSDILIDRKRGKLYLASSSRKTVSAVDLKSGRLLFIVGESVNFVGAFIRISDIALDKDGNLIVADPALRAIQVFNKDDGTYMYHVVDKDYEPPDRLVKDENIVYPLHGAPIHVNVDKDGRFWIYIAEVKGFSIREAI